MASLDTCSIVTVEITAGDTNFIYKQNMAYA
jgi:hypothetical protein